MRFLVDNTSTQIIVGGTDYLLPVDWTKELQDYLRVKVDGAFFSSRKGWDGYRYFITDSLRFATGFLPLVVSFVENLGAAVEIQDNRGELPELNDDININLGHIDGTDWVAFPHQVDAVRSLFNYVNVAGRDLYFPRGILDCATNAGKNSIAALILLNMKRKYRTIFVVNNRTIYKQAVKFFSQVIGEPVGEICSDKYSPLWFTVCMVKVLHNRVKESLTVKKWLRDTEVLIVDESDEAGAKEYSKTLSYCNAAMRVMVSGTPLDGSKVANMICIGLSGGVLYKVTNRYLIAEGYSQKPVVTVMLNDTPRKGIGADYRTELESSVYFSPIRLRDTVEIIRKHSGEPTLIAFTEYAHGEYILNSLRSNFPDLIIEMVHGTTPNREGLIADFSAGDIDVLISSVILKRGANIKVIRAFILADGGKSKRGIKQWIGRILRHDGEHGEVYAYDWYDVGRYVGSHSRARLRIYKEEKFEVNKIYESRANGSPTALKK